MKLTVAGGRGAVGRHVVRAAERRGHDVVVLSRAGGQDLVTGQGLEPALDGAEAVIDVSSTVTTSARRAVRFFGAATQHLHTAERAAGVGHHVVLSVVGIDGVDASYYAGKLAQEQLVQDGPVPFSLLRSSQFHEFAEQVARRGAFGPFVAVPKAPVRPVAAREVAERLVELAEGEPAGRVRDLVGPRDEQLVDMVRRMLRLDDVRTPVVELALPGRYWRATASGVLRGPDDADRGSTSFEHWLRTEHTPATTRTPA